MHHHAARRSNRQAYQRMDKKKKKKVLGPPPSAFFISDAGEPLRGVDQLTRHNRSTKSTTWGYCHGNYANYELDDASFGL